MPIMVPNSSGGGGVTLSGFTPLAITEGAATARTSFNPASYQYGPIMLPNPVTFNRVNYGASFSVNVPAATSQNSSGSNGWWLTQNLYICAPNGTGASSSQLSMLKSASFGLSATMSYSSSSQSFGMTWVTNSTGGTSTFSTTSGSNNWSSYMTGWKRIQVPCVTLLTQGDYLFVHHRSTAQSTSGSSVVPLEMSMLVISDVVATMGVFGSAGSIKAQGVHGNLVPGQMASSDFVTNATMAISSLSHQVGRQCWLNVTI